MTVDLFLEGKRFISVKRASQETGYSQDYIGQLSRHGKIPAKLVGRAWYVDFDSILSYQKNISKKGTGKRNFVTKEDKNLLSPKNDDVAYANLVYRSEQAPVLPVLQMKRVIEPEVKKLKVLHSKSKLLIFASVAVTVFVCANSAFQWLSFLAPRQAEVLNNSVVSSYMAVLDKFGDLERSVWSALASINLAQAPAPVDEGRLGVVAFPDSPDTGKKVEEIKNTFSDEVNVYLDEGGESGVIRPVFRPGENADDYAFVLVPIKSKK
ncbi:MAG: hypothetical protein AAB660_02735 [Patescibacteria group bacterium]